MFKNALTNPWIDIESRTESYMERLMVITSIADAFVVLKGGIGTLAETTFVWASTTVGELRKPMVLVGGAWQRTIDDLSKHLLITRRDTEVLKVVRTPEEAVELLSEFWPDR